MKLSSRFLRQGNLTSLIFSFRKGNVVQKLHLLSPAFSVPIYLSKEGEDITYCFRFQNDLIAAYSSFITGERSLENMQALSSAELLVMKKSELEDLTKSSNWIKFLKNRENQLGGTNF